MKGGKEHTISSCVQPVAHLSPPDSRDIARSKGIDAWQRHAYKRNDEENEESLSHDDDDEDPDGMVRRRGASEVSLDFQTILGTARPPTEPPALTPRGRVEA